MLRLNFLFLLAFGSGTAVAFSPPSSSMSAAIRLHSHSAKATTKTTTTLFSGLEVVDESTSDAATDAASADATATAPETETASLDPFESYMPIETTIEVAYKDTFIGSGYTVGEKPTQVLTIKYTAIFIDNDTTRKVKPFDFSESFVCKTGSNAILPGYEEGLAGMKVGGKRIIRIPPNKGYGGEWYKGTIPPNSHLEFDCELKSIAQTPQEEIIVQVENFGTLRLAGIIIFGGYLAASPFFT